MMMGRIPALLLLVLCVGCQPATAATAPLLTRAAAIEAAVRIASASRPELGAAQVTPSPLQAEQLTLGEAVRRLPGAAGPPGGYRADMPVWLVTLAGQWQGLASAPGGPPDAAVYRSMAVILDARTGLEIESQASP
jgi:hypothetical protein